MVATAPVDRRRPLGGRPESKGAPTAADQRRQTTERERSHCPQPSRGIGIVRGSGLGGSGAVPSGSRVEAQDSLDRTETRVVSETAAFAAADEAGRRGAETVSKDAGSASISFAADGDDDGFMLMTEPDSLRTVVSTTDEAVVGRRRRHQP